MRNNTELISDFNITRSSNKLRILNTNESGYGHQQIRSPAIYTVKDFFIDKYKVSNKAKRSTQSSLMKRGTRRRNIALASNQNALVKSEAGERLKSKNDRDRSHQGLSEEASLILNESSRFKARKVQKQGFRILSNGNESVITFSKLSRAKKRLASQLIKKGLDNKFCCATPMVNTDLNDSPAVKVKDENPPIQPSKHDISLEIELDVSDVPHKPKEPPIFENKINLKTQSGNSFSQASLAPKVKTRTIFSKKNKIRKKFAKIRSYNNLERDKSERIKVMEKKRRLMIKNLKRIPQNVSKLNISEPGLASFDYLRKETTKSNLKAQLVNTSKRVRRAKKY
ncbi:unnamed protein product [Moneuplotes crassus]|uniref:Uncharacterized protein n=1 Tax=Euplotes crassus TaxID=5936 RepID=A0AAD1XBF3_EUPCR|nr:unnamed protein product [Moneuplotes crassus]